jgi:predicted N-acyltransferase
MPPPVHARVLDGLGDVAPEEWNACAGDADPFVGHAFLSALERSGSVSPATGWRPEHVVLEDAGGRLLAAAPLYLKSHSLGEYVFDWAWARAAAAAGLRYYPKLQSCVPFTPVGGPRLMVRTGEDAARLRPLLVGAMLERARALGASSLHVTFLPRDEWEQAGALGLLQRRGMQFHWHNRGYRSHDDFLATLSSRKRKLINKERRRAAGAGLALRTLRGDELDDAGWNAFYRFYRATVDKNGARAYLRRELFPMLARSMGERLLVTVAEKNGRMVAAALHFRGARALYGRYWGSEGDRRWLHFELCYYRAIEHAIDEGLERVEAGAQGGEHKLGRGYLPVFTYSAHFVADPALRAAVAEFLERERTLLDDEMRLLASYSPYRAAPEP